MKTRLTNNDGLVVKADKVSKWPKNIFDVATTSIKTSEQMIAAIRSEAEQYGQNYPNSNATVMSLVTEIENTYQSIISNWIRPNDNLQVDVVALSEKAKSMLIEIHNKLGDTTGCLSISQLGEVNNSIVSVNGKVNDLPIIKNIEANFPIQRIYNLREKTMSFLSETPLLLASGIKPPAPSRNAQQWLPPWGDPPTGHPLITIPTFEVLKEQVMAEIPPFVKKLMALRDEVNRITGAELGMVNNNNFVSLKNAFDDGNHYGLNYEISTLNHEFTFTDEEGAVVIFQKPLADVYYASISGGNSNFWGMVHGQMLSTSDLMAIISIPSAIYVEDLKALAWFIVNTAISPPLTPTWWYNIGGIAVSGITVIAMTVVMTELFWDNSSWWATDVCGGKVADGLVGAQYSQYPADLVGGKPITDKKLDIPGVETQPGHFHYDDLVHGKSTICLDSLALTDNWQVMERIQMLLSDYRDKITYERGIGGENE